MTGITARSRGGYKRRLCNAHNDIGARVKVGQSHPFGYEHGAKVKSYDMMKIAQRPSTASRAKCSLRQG